MKRNEIVTDRERMYALTQSADGSLYLEVVVGGFAMENIVLKLTQSELGRYKDEGKAFLDDFALEVCKDTSSFRDRQIE